ncbi:hypothetical protein LUZ60_014852 [Juncus effusus]|nr:hypothetical protein LUZ60_014852 [Juncus effusus]
MWMVLQNKILTGENWSSRGGDGPYNCVCCNQPLETVDHLLFQCQFARRIWGLIYHHCGFENLALPQSIDQWSVRIQGLGKEARSKWDIWMAWTCWGIWLARNSAKFQGVQANVEECFWKIKCNLNSWLRCNNLT